MASFGPTLGRLCGVVTLRRFSAWRSLARARSGASRARPLLWSDCPCREVYKCMDMEKREVVAVKKVLLKREMEGVRCCLTQQTIKQSSSSLSSSKKINTYPFSTCSPMILSSHITPTYHAVSADGLARDQDDEAAAARQRAVSARSRALGRCASRRIIE